MANFFTDNDDLSFYLEKGVDWAQLAEVTEHGFTREEGFKNVAEAAAFYKDVLTMVGELSAKELAPSTAAIDKEGVHVEKGEAVIGPAFQKAFGALTQADLHRLCVPRELGGLNAPLLVYFISCEVLGRGDIPVMAHYSFHSGMAMAMVMFSLKEGSTEVDASGRITKTRFAKAIEEISSGAAWGCMDITEPNAGSDMAALRTKAEQAKDGSWTVTGQKIFITSGHGKYHFVIARTEEAKNPSDPLSGLAGLSMFLVKTYDDLPDGTRKRYVTLERTEEKLGQHGSVTAALDFDHAPAELIGKRGDGFPLMLVLMNNARIGVGFESLAVAESAYRLAAAYAEERTSMGKPIARHELIADLLEEMRTDIQGIRALAMAAGFHEEMATKKSLDVFGGKAHGEASKEVRHHRHVARRYTPLLKYLASEKAVEIARRGMQIHGGVGYTKEYGAEKLMRDALVLPIYEGTSQIQALMAMKDTLVGILKRPKDFVTRIGQARWRAMSSLDPLERRVAKLTSLSLSAQQYLLTRTAAVKLKTLTDLPVASWKDVMTRSWDPKRDFALAMLHAERLTRLLADEAVAEELLSQARRFPERKELLERWLERAEVRARALHDEITTTGDRLLATLAEKGEAKASGA
jgi:alkylation response protein AidB-like acyl-CoA dehydrogenase